MNDNENKRNTMYGKIPAVARLNKVPGFDPLQFLRPVISDKTQETLLKLDLRYQKLWFRLAHPQGRMKLTALHITDQMAIFEAKVFLDRSDNEPISSFVASMTREETPNYIKETQESALNTALSDAGFGLQFADVSVGREGELFGSTIPLTAQQTGEAPVAKEEPVQAAGDAAEAPQIPKEKVPGEAVKVPQAPPVAPTEPVVRAEAQTDVQRAADSLPVTAKKEAAETSLPAENAVAKTAPAEPLSTASAEQGHVAESLPTAPAVKPTQAETLAATPETKPVQAETLPAASATEPAQAETLPVTPATEPVREETLPVTSVVEKAQPTEAFTEGKTVPFARPAAVAAGPQQEPVVSANEQNAVLPADMPAPVQEQKTEQAAAAPRYTADMPVDEIAALMTCEEARAVKVDMGICNGWTIGQVADQRTPSLKFYLYGNKGNNNILRAVAKVMLDSLTEQKAG